MTRVTAGYDIGGAHLKVARVEDGRLTRAEQFACELWNGLDHLTAALDAASDVTRGATLHAVTMTGELCENFSSRRAGVRALSAHVGERLGRETRFYAGLAGFKNLAAVDTEPDAVASANFLATATAIALLAPHALLIDIGSTTTDIIACDRPQGLNDAERLQTGELVYTGLTRTPVASITTRAVLAGHWQSLARDTFATMADVRRVLGTLPDDVDLHATADGRGKSVSDSLQRLARGFGRDAEVRHLDVWKASAAFIRECQLRTICDGALQVLSRPGQRIERVVTAGIGADEAQDVARRLGLPSVSFGSLLSADGRLALHATRFAPAVAVALAGQRASA